MTPDDRNTVSVHTTADAGRATKLPKIARGHKRQWLRCRTCANVAFYDYVPYSFSNPITTTPCGHGIGCKDMGSDHITEQTAIAVLAAAKGAGQ